MEAPELLDKPLETLNLLEEENKLIQERLAILERAIEPDGFPYFVEKIFSQSADILKGGQWTGGPYIENISSWLAANPKTIRLSAKDHFKSMSFYAHIMWKILRLYMTDKSREIQYFSYNAKMSAYHCEKIKMAIECNPFFAGITDSKAQADSIISYTWNGKNRITVKPRGLLEFKRGIHSTDIYVDDPFQDPDNKMLLTKISKINQIMKTQILDMAQEELHIAGTAQTTVDFFFDKDFINRFSVRTLPAIVDESKKIALWPEWMSFDELKAKERERGTKVFNQEYLCSPVFSENAYIEPKKLDPQIKSDLKNHTLETWAMVIEERVKESEKKKKPVVEYDKVAGWDLGKKQHPAHFTVFEKREKKRVQIHSKWFDGIDYQDQLQYITEFIEGMGIYKVFYDSTRGELDMLTESGELPPEFQGVHFTHKGKVAMAEALDRALTQKAIEFVSDPRQRSQILIVNNELQAPTTPEGHGDAFWSTGMTFSDMEDEGVDIHFVSSGRGGTVED